MRELKFRGWNDVENKFYYCSMQELWEESNGELCGEEGREVEERVENFLIAAFSKCQQFTSLKDMNGKEIYEGDIVKGAGVADELCYIEWDIGNVQYRLLECGSNARTGFLSMGMELEVVGNIFENPELLSE
jgi:uncharacterized phage protein (TIGR01671 family)